tara:strand:- start:4828 stop:5109 length:282 start_codon:yes stop_codon:yes gene_type:complete
MNITKNDIAKKINKDTELSSVSSKLFLDKFIELIKREAFNNKKIVKLNNFGSFKLKSTPKRVGRNPKTKDSYIIEERNKLTFITSSKIRELIN